MYTSIKIRDYKCFVKENDYQGFDEIKPINVIIGKNNSGKSKLLEALGEFVNKGENCALDIVCSRLLTEHEVAQCFSTRAFTHNLSGIMGWRYDNDWDNLGKYIVNHLAKFRIENSRFKCVDVKFDILHQHIFEKISGYLNCINFNNPFTDYRFLHLRAERDIDKEKIDFEPHITNYKIEANASGICSLIARMLNDAQGHSELLLGKNGNKVNWKECIEQDLLSFLNEIVAPEIVFSRIYTLIDPNGVYEIYLEEKGKGGIKLSDCGSGLKTIIATLMLLRIVPCLSGSYKNIFAFEELENNLHPSLQRKLLKHIKEYSNKYNDAYVFLTTHSNVAIDLFGHDEGAQIIRVCNDGSKSTVEPAISPKAKQLLLDDLGFKASDLLQSNCVIWVEGPSDRIYIKKWLKLFGDKDLEEGLAYQFLYYGGTLLSHYTADIEEDQNTDNLLEMLKINRNSYVIMDSDKRLPEDKWKNRVERITKELPDAHWVTAGKEIENYLPSEAVTHYLGSTIDIEQFSLFPDIYKEVKQVETFDKVKFASDIIKDKNYTKENLAKCLDLEEQISKLIAFIRKSNLHPC